MADPTVTLRTPAEGEAGEAEKEPQLTFVWDFSDSDAPSLDSPVTVRVEWRPLDRPPLQQSNVSVVRWGRASTSVVGQKETPPADDTTAGALVTVPRRFFQGAVQVTIDWTPKDPELAEAGKRTFSHTEQLGDPVNQDAERVKPEAHPQLSALLRSALNDDEKKVVTTTEAEPAGAARFGFRGEMIHRALVHLHRRLRAGLGGFWYSFGEECRDPTGQKALSEATESELGELNRDQLEEAWAQLVTEMTLGLLYNGPGSFMDLDQVEKDDITKRWHPVHRQDAKFFSLVRKFAQADDLVFPLVVACQQLSTMISMSRSSDFYSLGDDPLDCGAPVPNGKLDGKKVFQGDEGNASTRKMSEKGWLQPGVCIFRKNTVRHVATILRAYKSLQGQLIDTGGWNTATSPFPIPPTDPPKEKPQPGVVLDTVTFKNLNAGLFGVAVPPEVSDEKLREALRRLRGARSLGFTRVVIGLRGTGDVDAKNVLWVSRKLPMHENDGGMFHHYPIARLMAALRGLPHADRLDVRFQLWIPFQQPAVENAFGTGRTARWWENGTPEARKFRTVAEFQVTAAGVPTVRQRAMQGVTRLPIFPKALDELEENKDPAVARATFPELADVRNDELPPYFRK